MEKKHKLYLFYGICVCLVLYFMWGIMSISHEITLKELEEPKEKVVFDFNNLDLLNNNAPKEFLSYGQYIQKISVYLLNIFFTLIIMIKAYIDEENE